MATDFTAIYKRVQEAFNPEDMTKERLKQWFYHGEKGKHEVLKGLDAQGNKIYREVKGKPMSPKTQDIVDNLSDTSAVYYKIKSARYIKDLNELKKDARVLNVHSAILLKNIEDKIISRRIERKEKQIARSFAVTSEFAKKKGITLSDKVVGKIEKWKTFKEKIITIREKGRFKSWKRI